MKKLKNKKVVLALVVGIAAVLILIAITVGRFAENDTDKPTQESTTEFGETMCLLFCFMLIYIVVILAQIVSSVGVLFA